MKYCADTWFILQAFAKNTTAISIIEETRRGKVRIIIPIITFAESHKKLMQRGVSQRLIDDFFEGVEASEKVELILIDKAIAGEAARISHSYNVPLIDSFVAATSKLTACDLLLTGDSDYNLLIKSKYIKTQSW